MKTKKTLAFLLVLTLCLGLLAGCGKKSGTGGTQDSGSTTVAEDQNQKDPAGQENADQQEDGTDVQDPEKDGPGNDSADSQEPSGDAGNTEKIDMEIAALKGPTAIGMIQMMENSENGKTANNYHFTLAGTADEITPKIANGELDMAAVPCNLASVLYHNTDGGIQLAAINTLGVLYIVETGDTIRSVEDLKGKTIYSTGKGTTPEYTLNELLLSAGLEPEKDVTIEFKSEASEVAAILSESDDAVAMLPQPFVTTAMMNNDKIRIALDVTKEWETRKEGSTVVTGVLIVNSQFAEEHPEAVTAFLEEYRASTDYVNGNVDEAAELVEKFDIVKAAVAAKAIPYCNITLITGDEMRQKTAAYLTVLLEQNPKAIGGSLPDDDFYLK